MADHGTEFKTRFELMQERIEAMKVIWTKSKPEYSGRFVNFPPMMTWPKPVQKPHPPVIVGGAFPYSVRAAPSPTATAGCRTRAGPPIREVLRAAAGIPQDGRPTPGATPPALPITVFGVAQDADLIKKYRDAGVARIIFQLPAAKADEVLPLLDKCAGVIRQVNA